jgi:general secretion pathway protein D
MRRARTLSLAVVSALALGAPSALAQRGGAGMAPATPGVVPMGQPGTDNAAGATGGQAQPAPAPGPRPQARPQVAQPAAGTGAGGGAGATGAKPGTGAAPQVGPGGKAVGDTQGLAQFEQGIEYEPRNPNYRVAFSLEDADLPELVRVIGQLTGKRFIFGGKVRNIKATVYSPQKVTVGEAYQAFLSILETNGLTVVPHGRFLKIVETGGIANQSTPVYGSAQAATAEERYVTRIHRLQHASADEVANVLGHFKSKDGDITIHSGGNLLILTDTGSNIRRMMQIVEEIDVGSSGDQIWIEPIHYSAAGDVAARINELFDLKGGGTAPAAPGGKGPAPASAAAGAGTGMHVTKVVADDRSNSVVVVATEAAYLRILEFIKRIDVPQSGEGEIHVLPLQHADAKDLVKTLNEVVSAASSGAGAAPPGRAPAAGGAAAAGQEIFEGRVKVSADEKTNSIVITSSLRDYASLRAVIDKLDQPRRQVFIEAVVMDLSVNRQNTLGVNFHGAGTIDTPIGAGGNSQSILFGGLGAAKTILPPNPADPAFLQGLAAGLRGPEVPGSQNILPGVSIPAFGVLINALQTDGDSDVLSTPHILATDNEEAVINVGENVALQQNVGGLPSTGAGAATPVLSTFGTTPPRGDVGTKIKLKPHLNESDDVRLDIDEEISEAREPQGQLGVVPITKRTATTKLVVRDQQTVVIGGLMRNRVAKSQQKIPLLGDIPVLGILFRTTTSVMQKSNLVLILTPYIIREQNDLRTVFERKMQERQEFIDRYFLFSDQVEYNPPRDYSRTVGLLEDIRRSFRELDGRKRLDELTRPKELKRHVPGEPLEMPAGAGGPGPTTSNPGGPAPANVVVTPQMRSTDRIER